METHVLLLQIAAILIVARLFAEIAARFDTPRAIGELCAGIFLGPSILGWIEPSDPIKLLAEIGIILLLFEIGLETDLGRMIRSGPRALVLALAGFIAPFVLGAGLCYYTFNLPLLVSLFAGGTLTATSIGVTVRVLADLGRQRLAPGVGTETGDFATKGDIGPVHIGGRVEPVFVSRSPVHHFP